MLRHDEKERITLENALKHPWFLIIKKNSLSEKYETKERPVLNRLKNFLG